MEGETTNDVGIPDALPQLHQATARTETFILPNAQRLIQIHERIINEVSKLQQKWIQKRSRTTTAPAIIPAVVTAASSNETVNETEQFQESILVQWPESILQQNKRELFQRLHELRKHRMALTAKIKVAKRRRKLSTKGTLDQHLPQIQHHNAFTHSDTNGTTTSVFPKENVSLPPQNLRLLYDSDYQTQVWHKIREMRQKKCIQAAYRLTGISMTMVPDTNNNHNSDDNNNELIMKIQFDIGHTISYDCLLDIVHFAMTAPPTSDDPHNEDPSHCLGQLFLRLRHHNLPSDIPIASIFQKVMMDHSYQMTVGDINTIVNTNRAVNMMIPIGRSISSILINPTLNSGNEPSNVEQEVFIKRLQCFTQQIYHSCHAYHVRNKIYSDLQQLVVDTSGTERNSSYPYSIQQLHCTYVPLKSRTFKTIEFHIIHQFSSIDHVQITLHYTTDLCRLKAHQPVSVHVKIISPSNHMVDDELVQNQGINKKQKSSWTSSLSVLQHLEGTVSDVEDDRNDDNHIEQNHYEFIESTIRSFRSLPIQKAIQTVTNAMTEY